MAVRNTQQIRIVGYTPDPNVRLTSLKTEVLTQGDPNVRLTSLKLEVLTQGAGSGGPSSSDQPVIFIIAS